MGATKFQLRKWYADCVSDDGEIIIAYVADLNWFGLELQYASLLNTSPAGKTNSTSSILNIPSPEISASRFEWRSSGMNFSGAWNSRQPAIQSSLYESPAGSIHWECLQPLSEAALVLHGRQISGLGYVERLDMTLPPWKMPIDKLNWGRFLAANRSVVWIDWLGEHPLRNVWIDGVETAAEVSDFRLDFSSGSSLTLQKDAVIRDGVIGETVLNVIPKWLGPLPGRLLGIHEQKWRSQGKFLTPNQNTVEGWAIHEVVQWPK